MSPKDGLKLLKKLTSRDFAGLKEGEIDSKLKGSNKAIDVVNRAIETKDKKAFLEGEYDVDINSLDVINRKFLQGTGKSGSPNDPVISSWS